jgi:hypothetical protein
MARVTTDRAGATLTILSPSWRTPLTEIRA